MTTRPPKRSREETGDDPVGPGGDENQKAGLLYANNLIYTFPNDYSVCVNSTRKEQLFATRKYTDGDTMICTLNTGADYIDPKRSYLQFDIDMSLEVETKTGLSPDTFDQVTFGKYGTALNCIKEIFVQSRSGDDLFRIRNFNVMQHTAMKYTYPVAWWETIGRNMSEPSFVTCSQDILQNLGRESEYNSLMGKSDPNLQVPAELASKMKNESDTQVWASGYKRITIPLYCLGGIFATDKLLPSSLCSGLNIRIQLEKARFATVWGKSKAQTIYDNDNALVDGYNRGVPLYLDDGKLDDDQEADTFVKDLQRLREQVDDYSLTDEFTTYHNEDVETTSYPLTVAYWTNIRIANTNLESYVLTVYIAKHDDVLQPLKYDAKLISILRSWGDSIKNRKWYTNYKTSTTDPNTETGWSDADVTVAFKQTSLSLVGSGGHLDVDPTGTQVVEIRPFVRREVNVRPTGTGDQQRDIFGGTVQEWTTASTTWGLAYNAIVNDFNNTPNTLIPEQLTILTSGANLNTSFYPAFSAKGSNGNSTAYEAKNSVTDAHFFFSTKKSRPSFTPAYIAPVPGDFELNVIDQKFNLTESSSSSFGPGHLQDIPSIKDAHFVVREPKFIVHACQLTDAAQRALNEVSAMNGLEIVYYDYENTSAPPDGNQDVHIEVKKAVSRALKAFAVVRDERLVSLGAEKRFACITNSMACETFRVQNFYWQLGSLYFPHQRVDVGGNSSQNRALHTTAHSAYIEAVDCFGRFEPQATYCLVTPDMFKGNSIKYMRVPGNKIIPNLADMSSCGYSNELQPSHDGAGILAVSLERSTLFKLSGVPINNSRVLMLHAHFDRLQNDDKSKSRMIDIFLKYVKIARVFIHNVEVEE